MTSRFPLSSVVVLIGANIVPVLGVLFLDWRVFPILLLYSLENIVIGFYNVLRMLVVPCNLKELRAHSEGIHNKRGLILFFCLHYGMFTGIHLLLVIVFFGLGFLDEQLAGPPGGGPSGPRPLETVQLSWIGVAVACLLVSHGVSYVQNFIRKREYKRVDAKKLFFQPYARVIVLHLTIILGVFAVMVLGTSLVALILFVVLKIVADVIGHLRERKKFRKPAPQTT